MFADTIGPLEVLKIHHHRSPAGKVPATTESAMGVLVEVVGGLVIVALIVRGFIAFYQDFTRKNR